MVTSGTLALARINLLFGHERDARDCGEIDNRLSEIKNLYVRALPKKPKHSCYKNEINLLYGHERDARACEILAQFHTRFHFWNKNDLSSFAKIFLITAYFAAMSETLTLVDNFYKFVWHLIDWLYRREQDSRAIKQLLWLNIFVEMCFTKNYKKSILLCDSAFYLLNFGGK